MCKLANAACDALKAPILLTLSAARETVRAVGNSLDIAKERFRAAERIADAASRGLSKAVDILDEVKDAFRDGLRLIAKIASYGLKNLLNIKEISFEASLDSVNAEDLKCQSQQ